jgi:hypothetical protein
MVSGQPVVAGGNSPEVLQPIERAFDAPAQLVEALAEAERLLPVAAVRNDRLGSALIQSLAQLGAVLSLVAEQAFRRRYSANKPLGDRTIVCLASGQQMAMRRPLASASA